MELEEYKTVTTSWMNVRLAVNAANDAYLHVHLPVAMRGIISPDMLVITEVRFKERPDIIRMIQKRVNGDGDTYFGASKAGTLPIVKAEPTPAFWFGKMSWKPDRIYGDNDTDFEVRYTYGVVYERRGKVVDLR